MAGAWTSFVTDGGGNGGASPASLLVGTGSEGSFLSDGSGFSSLVGLSSFAGSFDFSGSFPVGSDGGVNSVDLLGGDGSIGDGNADEASAMGSGGGIAGGAFMGTVDVCAEACVNSAAASRGMVSGGGTFDGGVSGAGKPPEGACVSLPPVAIIGGGLCGGEDRFASVDPAPEGPVFKGAIS